MIVGDGQPDPPPQRTARLSIPFTTDNRIELGCILRHLRLQRDRMNEDILKLEEKIRGGMNGVAKDAILVLQGEVLIMDEAIKRMWVSYSS